MSLPTIEAPKYQLTIPSTGEVVDFRPFLVKEEKILLIAQETGTQAAMTSALKDIVRSCTFNKVDLYKLTMYDIEYIFLKLRAKSVGETSTISVKCSQCDEYVEVDVNLMDVEISTGELPDNNMQLTDDVGIVLKVPGLRDMERNSSSQTDDITMLFDSIASVIDKIYDANEVYETSETSPKELRSFIETLSHQQLEKIQAWIEKMPRLAHTIEFTCSNGHKNERTLTGLGDFFV